MKEPNSLWGKTKVWDSGRIVGNPEVIRSPECELFEKRSGVEPSIATSAFVETNPTDESMTSDLREIQEPCNGRVSTRGLIRVGPEEDEYHHAGDRNVEPDGEGKACDSAVHREPARQREKERREHHWQRDDGKDYVAG